MSEACTVRGRARSHGRAWFGRLDLDDQPVLCDTGGLGSLGLVCLVTGRVRRVMCAFWDADRLVLGCCSAA